MAEQLKVSIITTTFQDRKNLENIILQILEQDYENIEYIIVDGKSTDGTIECIQSYEEKFQGKLKWISEKDSGIYDAINKGLLLATGEIIGCCFDRFTGTDVISRMVHTIESEHSDGVHADLLYMDGDRIVRTWRQGQGNFRTGWMPGHPTLYLKKSVYDKFGGYKTDYKVSADYEFMIRILKSREVVLSYIPEVLVQMSYGGTSTKGIGSYLLSLKEGHRALKENGVSFAWVTDCLRTLRVLLQFIRN